MNAQVRMAESIFKTFDEVGLPVVSACFWTLQSIIWYDVKAAKSAIEKLHCPSIEAILNQSWVMHIVCIVLDVQYSI